MNRYVGLGPRPGPGPGPDGLGTPPGTAFCIGFYCVFGTFALYKILFFAKYSGNNDDFSFSGRNRGALGPVFYNVFEQIGIQYRIQQIYQIYQIMRIKRIRCHRPLLATYLTRAGG